MPGLYAALQSAGIKGKRERYQQLRDALWTDRSTFDAHWREIGDYLIPTRTRFWTSQRNQGGKRNQNIIDSSARFAWRTLRSGMHSGITSPARPWFKLGTPDPELAEFKPVKEWLHVATERMLAVFSDTNLYNTLPTTYGDIGGFGTAAMSILEDSKDLFRARAYPIGSYALGLDHRGIANTFVRDYELSVMQVIQEFVYDEATGTLNWSNVTKTIRDLYDRGSYQAPVEICWTVAPNLEADPEKLGPKWMPFASCHFEKGQTREDVFLRESGFREFPIMAPRWETTGEDTYGTDCPGMTALGDIKQLQGMAREEGKAIKKMVNPPMVAAVELRTQKTSILPGDITYVREPQHGFRSAHEIGLNIEHLLRSKQDVRYLVQRAFYEDLFLMLAASDQRLGADRPTAREIEERHEEKLLALGPVLESMNDELLDLVVDRTYAMMDRAGLLPDPPGELDGVKLKVEYTSVMHQALKLVGVGSQDRFVMSLVPLVEGYPELRHKVNPFQIADNYAEMLGVDPRIVRSNEDAEARAKAEADQAKALADAQVAKDLGAAAKSAAATPMGTDSALDRLVQGAGTVQ